MSEQQNQPEAAGGQSEFSGLVMTDFSNADIANAKSLVSIGAEQDPDSPRAFWHHGHCFYVHPTEGVIEL